MKKLLFGLLVGLGVFGSANAALYLPSGPQTDVSLATVLAGGWTQCYAATFNVSIGDQGENVLNGCNGDLLMMAGRETGNNNFLVLAAAERADTIFETGDSSITHLANGSNWWYSDTWSWGFTAANDTVDNFQCDTSDSPTSMCLHTFNFSGGYRINNIQGLNSSTAYEKVFFVADRVAQVPEPATISLFGLGLLGFVLTRRKFAKSKNA